MGPISLLRSTSSLGPSGRESARGTRAHLRTWCLHEPVSSHHHDMRSKLTARRSVAALVVSLILALLGSLLIRSLPWAATAPSSDSDSTDDTSSHHLQTETPDLNIIPILPPSNATYNDTATVEVQILPGLGGSTPSHGPWDGHAVIISSTFLRRDEFSVLSPVGGCTSHSGHLSKTSANAVKNKCNVAINGSPFIKNGGCIGQSVSDGVEICPDCSIWKEIPSLGLMTTSTSSTADGSNNITSSSWVMSTDLNYTLAKSMGIFNLIVGHVPGWLVRNGTIFSEQGGIVAPRSAVGITADGTRLILLVVDGCEHCPGIMGGPQGLTICELAVEMKKLGADFAINLDGGGSSTLFHEGRVVNYPTSLDILPIWRERKVSTVLCLRL